MPISPELAEYVVANSEPLPEVAHRLIEETTELGRAARMQISPEQALFMRQLVRIVGSRRILEVGTFTGLSSLMMALGGAEKIVCLDISDEFTSVARRYWAEANVDSVIELRIGPALDSLRAMEAEESFDFVFIDADKANYLNYFELVLGHLEPGGVVAVDNTLWSGQVIDSSDQSEDTNAIRNFNRTVADDARVQSVILPIGDGLTLIRKR